MNDRLVWIDCEMTGLDLTSDALIEIACIVTDSELNALDDGIDVGQRADQQRQDRIDDEKGEDRQQQRNPGACPQMLTTSLIGATNDLAAPLRLCVQSVSPPPRGTFFVLVFARQGTA